MMRLEEKDCAGEKNSIILLKTEQKPQNNNPQRYSIDYRDDINEGGSAQLPDGFIKRNWSKLKPPRSSPIFSIESFRSMDSSCTNSTIQTPKSFYQNDKILLDFASLVNKSNSHSTEEMSESFSGTPSFDKEMASADQLNTAAAIYAEEARRILDSILTPDNMNAEENTIASKNTEFCKRKTVEAFRYAAESRALMKMAREKAKNRNYKVCQNKRQIAKHHQPREPLISRISLEKEFEDKASFDRLFSDDSFFESTPTLPSTKQTPYTWLKEHIKSVERFIEKPTQIFGRFDKICGSCNDADDDQEKDLSLALRTDKVSAQISQMKSYSSRNTVDANTRLEPISPNTNSMDPLNILAPTTIIEKDQGGNHGEQSYLTSKQLNQIEKKYDMDEQNKLTSIEENNEFGARSYRSETCVNHECNDFEKHETDIKTRSNCSKDITDPLLEKKIVGVDITNDRIDDNKTISLFDEKNKSQHCKSVKHKQELSLEENISSSKNVINANGGSKAASGKLRLIKIMLKKGKRIRGRMKRSKSVEDNILSPDTDEHDDEAENEKSETQSRKSARNYENDKATKRLESKDEADSKCCTEILNVQSRPGSLSNNEELNKKDDGTERYLNSPVRLPLQEQNETCEMCHIIDQDIQSQKSASSSINTQSDRYKIHRRDSHKLLLESRYSESSDKYSPTRQRKTKNIYSLSTNSLYGDTEKSVNSFGSKGGRSSSNGKKNSNMSIKIDGSEMTSSQKNGTDGHSNTVSPSSIFTGISSFVETGKWNGYEIY